MQQHPTALITGVTGQDGSYLAEYLLQEGYCVYGMVRRTSVQNHWRLQGVLDADEFELITGDLCDQSSLDRVVKETDPDEVYNLAAQSDVATSFEQPTHTIDVTGQGVVRLLEAIREYAPDARFYQASSSEMFGEVEAPQSEETEFHPRSPYACAKTMAHYAVQNYREAYDLYAACGILFNHESPRRGHDFVTRKITHGVAAIEAGVKDELRLGNLDARRDWGDARDYVRAMHSMLQMDPEEVEDFVIGTGRCHTVRELADAAFGAVGLDWEDYVVVDEEFYRPTDVTELRADTQRAEEELGWVPKKSFEELVSDMVDADRRRLQLSEAESTGKTCPDCGVRFDVSVCEDCPSCGSEAAYRAVEVQVTQ